MQAQSEKVRIVINSKKELVVKKGMSLLAALTSQGIFIPSACGGQAICGLCRVKIKNQVRAYLSAELPLIKKEEMAENIHLSCQTLVDRDLEIEIPEELFHVKRYATRVVRIRELTYDIKELVLELISPSTVEFKAGQYFQFHIPVYDQVAKSVYRAYSVSSAPQDNHQLEFEVRLVPNGIGATYVHAYLKVGDKLRINGPYGDFYLRETAKDIIFVAGGSGMAPVKSILLDMLHRGVSRNVTYFFGARTLRDLFLLDEMRALERELPGFTFIPALSEPEPLDKWPGEKGLITQVVERYLSHIDPGNLEAYLCGSPAMIDACLSVLVKKGIKEEEIFYDKFA